MKAASCIQVKDWSWLGQQHRPSVRLLLISQYRKFTRHYRQKSCEDAGSNTNERSTHMKLAASIHDTIFASQIPKETTESDLGWQLAWTELLPNNEYLHPT
jgi:hypothetical protein